MPVSQPSASESQSFRKRIFSAKAKAVKPDNDSDTLQVIDVRHGPENSGSTSTTLTEGQVPIKKRPPSPQTDETDREQASSNTSIKRKSFYKHRGAASDGALSSNSKSRARRKPRKPSFLSRFVRKVVPCVGPEPSVEKKADKEKASVKTSTRPSSEAEKPTGQPLSLMVPPPIDVSAPPSPADSEIIVLPPPSAHTLPDDETDGMTSGAVQPPGSTGTGDLLVRTHTRDSEESDRTSFTDDEVIDEQAEEERLIRNGGSGIPIGPDGVPTPLLPPIAPQHAGRKCLVLDLDETLVHSSFKAIPHPDFIVPVEIEYHWHHFHVLKRPGVDTFLKKMGEIYEIVVFTASLSKYADPVLDKLDIHQVVAHRLFRESCFNHKGNYVKDLSQLGRPITDTIILDNSPASYIFNPNNAVPVSSWFNDPHDAELTDLIPFLTDLTTVPDIRGILDPAR